MVLGFGFGGDTCVLPGNWGSTRGSTWGGISPVEQGWVLGRVVGVVLEVVL